MYHDSMLKLMMIAGAVIGAVIVLMMIANARDPYGGPIEPAD